MIITRFIGFGFLVNAMWRIRNVLSLNEKK